PALRAVARRDPQDDGRQRRERGGGDDAMRWSDFALGPRLRGDERTKDSPLTPAKAGVQTRPARKHSSRLASRCVQVGFLLLLVVLWYLATTRWGVSPLLLPNPVLVLRDFWEILRTGAFVGDLRVTLTELALAFLISASSGVIIGYLVSR